MIPEAAVEAAKAAYLNEFNYDENAEYITRLVLEAAAPHLTEDAYGRGFDDGHRAGQESMETE